MITMIQKLVVFRGPVPALMLAGLMSLLLGCAGAPPQRNPVPVELVDEAVVPGIDRARYPGDSPPPWSEEWLEEATEEELARRFGSIMHVEHHYLAISGGGANGAYGAGILVGWTEAGDRPEFTVVTGISTGALTAPFAFLGPDYDDELQEVYTTFETADLVESRGFLALFRRDATVGSAPLRAMIAEFVDDEMIARIAAEHAKGRLLVIGTTNLDTMRPIVWNITLIAASNVPDRGELIRDILLASASIPAGLPPVMFEVEVNGQRYDEMHVDGGTTSQVFFYPAGLDWGKLLTLFDVPGRPDLYVIRNARIEPRYKTTDRRATAIAMRALTSLLRTQGIADLYRIYTTAQRDGLEYHGAAIPDDFTLEATEMFDVVYMRELFNLGYERARVGYPWTEHPPGM